MHERRLNILLIVTDEERYSLPQPRGFALPARERLAERGDSFENYYVASATWKGDAAPSAVIAG